MSGQAIHFAVVDLETTGLFARGTDRIVEIAIIALDSDGIVTDEYCTLVNPGRDIGPTRIHGIEAWEKGLDPVGDTAMVFGGAAFSGDVVKTNVAAILEQHGLKNVRSL